MDELNRSLNCDRVYIYIGKDERDERENETEISREQTRGGERVRRERKVGKNRRRRARRLTPFVSCVAAFPFLFSPVRSASYADACAYVCTHAHVRRWRKRRRRRRREEGSPREIQSTVSPIVSVEITRRSIRGGGMRLCNRTVADLGDLRAA